MLFLARSLTGCAGCDLRTPLYTATSYSVAVVERGPIKTVVKVTYTFARPRYYYGHTVINGEGAGHYTFTATLYANSKSVLIDEDSDMQFGYYLPLYAQLQPDQARYRGHDGIGAEGVTDPVCGYETPGPVTAASWTSPVVVATTASLSNGQRVAINGVAGNPPANGTFYIKSSGYPAGQFGLYSDASLTTPVAGSGDYVGGGIIKPGYRGQNLSPAPDALLDITYNNDRQSSYRCDETAYRKLLANYPPAAHSAGWYAEVYNSAGAPDDPMVGIFTGRASQQSASATGPSLPGLYSSNKHWASGTQDAGIQIDLRLRGPDGTTAPVVHRNWGIFVSTQADLLAPEQHQPIADDQNGLTGINLSRLYTYTLSFPDPPGGWKWLYLSEAGANQLISQVRNGTGVCGSNTCYASLLRGSEGSVWGKALIDMWQGNSPAAVQKALDAITLVARKIVTALANGDNRFDSTFHYYQLGLQTSPSTVVLNAILMDANTTLPQKTLAKAELALFGSLFWDNDWFPVENNSGEGAGLANQVQQYLQYRTQSATAIPSHPFLATKVTQALQYPADLFRDYFSTTGAPSGSTHYQSAFLEPLIVNFENLAATGLLSMNDPKWLAYSSWELSSLTPPEPRFGNVRKSYSNGDGNTSANVRGGMLGTALRDVSPVVAGNLMWAWRSMNSPTVLTEDSQFLTTIAAIDPSVPAVTPLLGSVNIPGYHASERHGFGTPNETAVWLIDGGFYSLGGHRHYDDGQVTIYSQAAPLAIDWNANLYSPATPGRFQHNSVVFDTELLHPWNADQPGLADAPTLLQNPTNTEFAAFSGSTTATASFTASDSTLWTRTVRTMAFNPAYPVIYIRDTFSGPGAGIGKTLTWNMMAAGPVDTPAGPVTPLPRFSAGCQSVAGELPSSGNVYGLETGLQQFTFTGVPWVKHPAGGINWDLYTLSGSGTAQFNLGNWGHGCHASREAAEFLRASGRSFAETQHILRVHDTGAFTTILMPYAKAARPDRIVTQDACGTRIAQASETLCFTDSVAQYGRATANVLTVYDGTTQSAFDVTAAGGPQEIVIEDGRLTWTIGGATPGDRTLILPDVWQPVHPVAHTGNKFTRNYPGGLQAAPVVMVFRFKPALF